MSNASHGLCIREDGTMWGWGLGTSGQLGTGTSNVSTPRQVGTDTDWAMVSNANAHTLAIKRDGTLWATGSNTSGELGTGNTATLSNFTRVGTDSDWKLVSCGSNSTLALKNDGTLWSTGNNSNGQLGIGTTSASLVFTKVGTDSDWKAVSSGTNHTIAIKKDGTMWGWGSNGSYQLANGSTTTNSPSPIQIGTDSDWKDVLCGTNFTVAIKTDGTLWSWGLGTSGQLGHGSKSTIQSPTKIGTDSNWKSFSAGINHVLALKTDGTLWAWGNNGSGQLGDGSTVERVSPGKIGTESNWDSMSANNGMSYALKKDGTLWVWGVNNNYQLGLGSTGTQTAPIRQSPSVNTWRTLVNTYDLTWGFIVALNFQYPKVTWNFGGTITGDTVTLTKLFIDAVEVFSVENPITDVTYTIEEDSLEPVSHTLRIEATTTYGERMAKDFVIEYADTELPLLECDVRYNFENTDGEISEVVSWIEHDASCIPDKFEVTVIQE